MPPCPSIPVLVIGGSQPDVEFMTEVCALSGWEPSFTVVREGSPAFALVARCAEGGEPPPRLILLDRDALGGRTHELLVFIRERSGMAGVPVVVLTDIPDERERERSLSLGASAHVLKPIRLDDAERLVRQWRSLVPA